MGVKNWKLAGNNLDIQADAIQRKFALPRPIALFFAARGVKEDEVQNFLNPNLGNLTDPYRFPKIKEAAKRLWDAIANKETILIHGDYDTDGITASALLAFVLRQNGATVHSFIPHRFDDGYGFTPESLQKAIDTFGPASVLVTVDCGITSCDAIDEAIKRGIDVIVTDHHEAGAQLPNAIAIINPKVYPELEDLQLLAGAGAAFKLSHAFIKFGRENNLGGFQTRLEDVLDYVALGTVADIVPLLGENRVMVKYGIEALRRQIRPGIRALIESSKLRSDLTPSDITFRMAPRINAAGRVGDANVALQLLESEHIVDAYRCASQLESFNRVRQEKEQEIYQEAREQIERNLAWQSEYALLVAGRDWHQGVIGIVASRLARDYNRPTIVLTIQGDIAYGSGRSVACLNLVEVLSNTANLLDRYGGHPMAVGIGLKVDRIADFFEAMDREVRKQISSSDLEDFIRYDGEVQLNEITPDFFGYLGMLSPFGHSNVKPIYRFNEVQVVRCSPVSGSHTRGIVRDRTGQSDFIAFNRNTQQFYGRTLDILATPQLNLHQGVEVPQLNIIDIKEVF
ncbi:MAG: single-stranded-DNA-specific exonuclease RecJ [Victivallales bacterium]|jgi:single-stranded-DNA-specific exonuclease|nr:single-stranded-DNA-specific exonuclease RecJ [Victivallales bacterium]